MSHLKRARVALHEVVAKSVLIPAQHKKTNLAQRKKHLAKNHTNRCALACWSITTNRRGYSSVSVPRGETTTTRTRIYRYQRPLVSSQRPKSYIGCPADGGGPPARCRFFCFLANKRTYTTRKHRDLCYGVITVRHKDTQNTHAIVPNTDIL